MTLLSFGVFLLLVMLYIGSPSSTLAEASSVAPWSSEDAAKQDLHCSGDACVLRKLWQVFMACERVLTFFRENVSEMNLDAVIGPRLAEAQFKMLLEVIEDNMEGGKSVEAIRIQREIVSTLRSLQQDAAVVSALAEPLVKLSSPEYYNDLGKLLEKGFWEVPLSVRELMDSNSTRHRHRSMSTRVLDDVEQMAEHQSDYCISEELGESMEEGGQDDDRYYNSCQLSWNCWKLMTAKNYSGYSLTHQAFYIIIGIQSGCGSQIKQMVALSNNRSYEELSHSSSESSAVLSMLKDFCLDIYDEAVVIAEADFPETRQDLFLEQGALCGLLGYKEFFKSSWVERVLSWQREPGCFGDTILYEEHHYPKPISNHVSFRVKREESPMSERCLAHHSTVALGYLAICARFLILSLLI